MLPDWYEPGSKEMSKMLTLGWGVLITFGLQILYFALFFISGFRIGNIINVISIIFCIVAALILKYSRQTWLAANITAAVIFFFLLIVTMVPGIVFIIFKLIFAASFQFFTSYPWLILSVIAYSLLITIFFAFYTLLLSSIGKNRRYVAILIFGVYIFSDIFSAIFKEIFGSQYFYLLSIKSNLRQVGAVLFDQRTPWNFPWYYSLLVIAAICLFSAYMLKRKVRGVEIIK